MKLLTIAGNSLRRLLRDRANIFFIFVLPIALILTLGIVFGAGFTTRVLVVAPDDELAGDLVAAIADTDAYEVRETGDVDQARRQLRRNEADALVVIPDTYTADLLAGGTVEIGYAQSPNIGGEVRSVIEAAITDEASVLRAARFGAGAAGTDQVVALQTAEALAAVIPAVAVDVEGEAAAGGGGGYSFDTAAAQQLLLFMFITALTSSTALIQSRRLRVSQRMLSTPTSAGTIIAGETLGRFLVVMLQGVFIVVAAGGLFGVAWGNVWAAILVVIAFALTGTGAGMLLGSTFSNEQQAGGIAVFLALVLAALGGSMAPLEIFPDTMVTVAHLTPHAWGNDAFATLVRRGGGIADVATEILVLTAYGLGLMAIASVVFRRKLTRSGG
jgi:ABC-2 type transport system permease protein